MAHVTVKEALNRVSRGTLTDKDPIEVPIFEHVALALFGIANNPDPRVRGSMRRATRAQKIILDRLVGTRNPGSNPAAQKDVQIDFVDLTVPAIGGTNEK